MYNKITYMHNPDKYKFQSLSFYELLQIENTKKKSNLKVNHLDVFKEIIPHPFAGK